MTRFVTRCPQRQRAAGLRLVLALAVVTAPFAVHAADEAPPESFSVHGQFTSLTQAHPEFNSPYAGTNSLAASAPAAETVDMTLFLGLRLWRGAAFFVDPEIDQGYGLSGTLGVAGFPSGEAYKVGSWTPYYRLQRAYLRQTFALGEAQSAVEPGPNQLGGAEADDKLTLMVGKFSVVDLFDANDYAHDPRADFLNWAVIDSGAFDYAADAWGYTLGAALDWSVGDWSLRGGWFALSKVPNSEQIDTGFGQSEALIEGERRWRLGGRPGSAKLLAWVDRGRMGLYDDALALAAATATTPDTSLVRRKASKGGATLGLQQEVAEGVGFFARLGADNGRYETYDFSDINRSLSGGLSLDGRRWQREGDKAGLALVTNALSAPARAYFAAGGLGLLIGDGRLPHYGDEQIVEAFYAARVTHWLGIGADLQRIVNPAYNRDRGPVTVYGLRVHAEF